MTIPITSALVFQTDLRHPVVIRERLDIADFVGAGYRPTDPSARLYRERGNEFHLTALGSMPVGVNGRRIPGRPLRDGDEIVVGSTVAIFRQAHPSGELDGRYVWHQATPLPDRPFRLDLARQFDTLMLNCGMDRCALDDHVVEDWHRAPPIGPHFGFGRVRHLQLDPQCRAGYDHSTWELVGSGNPVIVKQRITSIGIPLTVIRWELSRTSDHASPFVTQSLVIGTKDEELPSPVTRALASLLGQAPRLRPATDEALWALHHTDRILGLPGRSVKDPDDALYCSISRM